MAAVMTTSLQRYAGAAKPPALCCGCKPASTAQLIQWRSCKVQHQLVTVSCVSIVQ